MVWDDQLIGFFVRRQIGNGRSFGLKSTLHGQQLWLTIGRCGSPFTVEEARDRARELLLEIKSGRDPRAADERQLVKPTLREFAERFLEEYARINKKPSSVRMDEDNLRNHLIPLLGHRRISDISKADVEDLKSSVRRGITATSVTRDKDGKKRGSVVQGGPGVANRCVALLSKMMNQAEEWGLRPQNTNPARGVRKYPGNCRKRSFTDDELLRLGQALQEAEAIGEESPYALAAIRLLAITGARLGEILSLRWENVDCVTRLLILPDTKTGPRNLPLTAPAERILKALPRLAGNPHVIVGRKQADHLRNLKSTWRRICRHAGVSNAQIHDFRRSFVSAGVIKWRLSPYVAGQLVGHRNFRTTERYIHAPDAHLVAATEDVANSIAKWILPA